MPADSEDGNGAAATAFGKSVGVMELVGCLSMLKARLVQKVRVHSMVGPTKHSQDSSKTADLAAPKGQPAATFVASR